MSVCPTPRKIQFPSLDAAAEAAGRLNNRDVAGGRPPSARAYECACGKWHLTSKRLRASA